MPLSPFIRNLREKIGNDLLLLPSVTAIILDGVGRVLLQRASEDGKWYTIGGSMEPGEQPADTVVREVKEETGLDVEPVRIVGVYATETVTYSNGHRCEFVATVFLCRVISGVLRVADEESLEFRYFAPDALRSFARTIAGGSPMRYQINPPRVSFDPIPDPGDSAVQADSPALSPIFADLSHLQCYG